MEAITFLTGWVSWLFAIIPIGAGCMITYFALRQSFASEDEKGEYKGKIKNTLIGSAVGLSIGGFVAIVEVFFM